MHLGYLTHVAGSGAPAAVYRDTIALAVAAEELGFESFWLAQHHDGALEGLLPSPLVLLAAIAERTSVIGLGTAVIAAPLEDPRRLAEDAAVLDELSGGRVELGVGAGADAVAARRFGRDHDRRHVDCASVVDGVRAVLRGRELVPDRPALADRMWWATGSRDGVLAAAARGMGIISGRPADPAVVASLHGYWTGARGEPRVAIARAVRVGEPAATVVDRWSADPALPWATHVLAQTQPAAAPAADHLATLRLLAERVRPALRVPALHT